MPSPARSSRARRVVALCLSILLLDLGLTLAIGEDGVFLGHPLPPFGAITHPHQQRWLDTLEEGEPRGNGRFDAELGWSWRAPSSDAEGVHIGALGARGPREYTREKPAGTRRILAFGDSFTFCDEIPDNASFEHILEGRAARTEVLNFGVSGYGTDQALLRFRRLGTDLGADVVLIGILLENIGRNVNRYRPLWSTSTGFSATKPRFLLEEDGELALLPQPFATRTELRSAILDGSVLDRIREHEYWFDRPRVPTGRLSSIVRLVCGVLAERERSPRRLWSAPAEEPYRVTVALLETFRDEALAAGIPRALVLIFPTRSDLDLELAGKPYWGGFLEELDRRAIPAIDLSVPLAARERELAGHPDQGTLYYRRHLSSVGNSVVADAILAWLEESETKER